MERKDRGIGKDHERILGRGSLEELNVARPTNVKAQWK